MALILPASIHNPSSGATIPSTWGDAVNAAIDYLGATKPRCRVYNSANISIANNTLTALTFNSERYDVGGCHSTVSATSLLTVPAGEGGKYLIGASVEFAINGTGDRQVGIILNGVTFLAVQSTQATSAYGTGFAISTVYALAAGDSVAVYVQQNSGGALNVSAAGNYSPEFWFEWIST